MIKSTASLLALCCLLTPIAGFSLLSTSGGLSSSTATALFSTPSSEERQKELLAQEAMNAANLKESAQRMKSMKPQDIEEMLKEMDNMPAAQLEQLKSMGMDPEIMKSTMNMMKDNPEMIGKMGEVMENMTPEELMEQSRIAQQNFGFMAQPDTTTAASTSTVTPITAEVEEEEEEEEDEEDEEDEEAEEPIEPVPEVLDAMYQVAEIMSIGDSSGVTFPGFCTIPPITLLSGTGEDDLSKKELTDCWNKGSLGASRVDREGFERVWRQVQESYYQDIVDEAQDRTLVRKRKRGSANKPEAPVAPATTVTPSTPTVGANVSPEILKESVSKLKDEDFSAMFDQMANMGPAEEARMKAMGVDPAMMKKSAAMMKNNPLLRRAATAMMKNTPTDQLVKASQQAQEKMANMTDEEKQRMMDSLK